MKTYTNNNWKNLARDNLFFTPFCISYETAYGMFNIITIILFNFQVEIEWDMKKVK